MLFLEPDPSVYKNINQGVLVVDGMDDVAEMKATDVSLAANLTSYAQRLLFVILTFSN